MKQCLLRYTISRLYKNQILHIELGKVESIKELSNRIN